MALGAAGAVAVLALGAFLASRGSSAYRAVLPWAALAYAAAAAGGAVLGSTGNTRRNALVLVGAALVLATAIGLGPHGPWTLVALATAAGALTASGLTAGRSGAGAVDPRALWVAFGAAVALAALAIALRGTWASLALPGAAGLVLVLIVSRASRAGRSAGGRR